MSVTIMSAVWPLDLPTTDKMVLLALADAANDAGVTWIAVRSRKSDKLDILTKCSLSERAVQGAIKRLEADRYLVREERPGRGVTYTVHPAADAPPHAVRPARNAPPQQTTQTPAADAGKPSVTVIPSDANASSGEVISLEEPIVLKPEHVVEAWNEMAGRTGLPKVKKLNPDRRKQILARIRQNTIEDFTEAISAIERSPFLRGENPRGWRADLDFLLQPKSFTRLIEGSYDGQSH